MTSIVKHQNSIMGTIMLSGNTPAGTIVFYRNMNADKFMDKFKRLGFRIRTSREDLGLKQGELAELSGVSRGYISKLEAGKKENPSMDILKALAKALNVPLTYLVEGDLLFDEPEEEELPISTSELLDIYEDLPEDDRLRILDFARRLAKNDTPRIIGS